MRTGKATILSVKRVTDKTPPHLLENYVIDRESDFLVLLGLAFLTEGVLKGDELDGVSNDCRALQLHQVFHAQTWLQHLPTTLHPWSM